MDQAHPTSNQLLSRWLNRAAVAGLLMGVVVGGLLFAQAAAQEHWLAALRWLGEGVAVLAAAIFAAAVLSALGRLLLMEPPTAHTLERQTERMVDELQSLQAALARPVVPTAAPPHAAPLAEADETSRALLARMAETLDDLREVVLLSDEQRQARRNQLERAQTQSLLEEVDQSIKDGHWSRASELLRMLQQGQGDDPAVRQIARRLAEARAATQRHTFSLVSREVENLMATADWDAALEKIRKFHQDFADCAEGKVLLERVEHERRLFGEQTVRQWYEQFKDESERKNWRRALGLAQKLLEKFSDHTKCEKVRAQLPLVQQNAEIEERQEQEQAIQLLIRTRRFDEAIEQAELLIRRFPLSPQAQTLDAMLPRLREMALQA